MSNKRIAKNTLMLYIRQILILLVSLYMVRVVMNVLGVEDYGIYSVVGGIVTFFSFLSGTMASATQRFFSFALGQNDAIKLKKTFTVNWLIYGAIAVIALLLLETVGIWFVNNQLIAPVARFESIHLVFHFSVLTFIATIITAPFMAIIIAHEDMHIYAYISIVEVIMKLATIFLLIHFPWDKMELYGLLLFAVSLINAIIYISICFRKYAECQFRTFFWDKALLKEIVSFTGWTLFGQVTTVFRNQAVTVLVNQVFNPIVVAARVIATNVTSHINVFSSNFNTGLYPPIIKSYAADDMKVMFSYIFFGCKITFFLNWIFSLSLFLEMETVLTVWLENPPDNAVLFTRLALIESLIFSVSMPITTAARAPGRMRAYELILGCMQILIFVFNLIVLKMGAEPYAVFLVAIIVNLLMFAIRLLIVSKLISFPIGTFFRKVIFPVTGIASISFFLSGMMHLVLPRGFFYACISILFSVLISTICTFFLGLNKEWKQKCLTIIMSKIGR